MLRIKQANPMHSVQDLGRYGFASQGVAKAGPMDSVAACWANSCLGNAVTLPLLEIGGGGFVAEFTKDVNLALTGAWGEMTLDGSPCDSSGIDLRAGVEPRNGLGWHMSADVMSE